jgi:hypothetical protein
MMDRKRRENDHDPCHKRFAQAVACKFAYTLPLLRKREGDDLPAFVGPFLP